MVARNEAGSGAEKLASEARAQTQRLRQQVVEAAGRAMDQARENAEAAAQQQKQRAADELTCIAAALRAASQKLHEEQEVCLAPLADGAADGLDHFASYMRDRDMWALIDDVRDLAHRRPEWFIGGAFVIGLVAARFLKSSGAASANVPARLEDVSAAPLGQPYASGAYRGDAGAAGPDTTGTGALGGADGPTSAF